MSENLNFEEIKKNLEEQIKQNKIEFDSFKKAINSYKDLGLMLEKLLEYAARNIEGDDKDKFWGLYKDISFQNVSELCDRLRKYGENLRHSKVYERFYDSDKKAPKSITFRILELIRLGKRDEVFYIILREFVNAQQEVDQSLIKAFNPRYSVESFKVLVYSFLSGLLEKFEEIEK
ncbi:hypothetical protein [Thermovenabulum gondwanense]|uniref:Uncharacterized protein n=1 Tax=Thermovenabulum gondwanense TaxID=520767 RepID=A0A162MU11_9FIRM|nr:hypothetical protein [Thermovenabulum gondwanense]KYO67335.1 hypothetical protein ATZ99_06210 [Thermovenabulum gondwanense]